MTTHGLARLLSSLLLSLTTVFTGALGTSAVAQAQPRAHLSAEAQSRTPACVGVTSCHRVATADVDGDGRPDRIAWRQLSDDAVQIRVSTAAGALLTHRVGVHFWWGGGAWGGAAYVDDRPGVELLIGSMQGAHTPMYTMLTYRTGALVVEQSPSSLSRLWQVDAAYGDYLGWWRHRVDGRIAMTQHIAYRDAGGTSFSGRDVTYVRTAHGWARATTKHTRYPTERAASAIGGFRVTGLAAFPGLG
jgi:hypothetical protein